MFATLLHFCTIVSGHMLSTGVDRQPQMLLSPHTSPNIAVKSQITYSDSSSLVCQRSTPAVVPDSHPDISACSFLLQDSLRKLSSYVQVAPMSLSTYVQQSSLRSSRNDALLQPSARLSLRRYA